MPGKILNSASKQTIGLASATGLASRFQALNRNIEAKRWLRVRNRYRANPINRIKQDLASVTGVNSDHLGEYIAASVPLHCADGWTFLSRALTCYINGSPHQAAHFAYYAELRAAMSILAAQGIGIFNNKHFVVTALGQCQAIAQQIGTHDFAWLALEEWSQRAQSGDSLLDLFVVSRSSVKEWFASGQGTSVAGSLAGRWLKEWGLDLSVLGQDHLIRNMGSYRPNELSPLQTDAKTCSKFLTDLWSLFRPSASSFEYLDRHLFRILLRRDFSGRGQKANLSNPQFVSHIDSMLAGLSMSDQERMSVGKFLVSRARDPLLLQRATKLGPAGDITAHERIIVRAGLLLRVASGFNAMLINQAMFTANDLAFWTDPWAERQAFWAPGNALDNLSDLWADVSTALDEEEDWLTAQSSGSVSMFQWRSQRAESMRPLGECERVGLWSLQR